MSGSGPGERSIPEYRVGIGYDLHRLGADRPLRIAGVDIARDGGAVGNTDPANRNADSSRFVAETMADLRNMGWELVNADLTIVLERPQVSPYADAMRQQLAAALGSDMERISLKAKTNEGVDAVGTGEAVACQAVVLVSRGVAQVPA